MDVLTTWEATHVAWWASVGLTVMAVTLLAWFPGYNAFQRHHDFPSRVRAASWGLVLAMTWLVVAGWEPMFLTPAFLAFWVATVVWSYGKRVFMPVASAAGGFEVRVVIPAQDFSIPELATSAA